MAKENLFLKKAHQMGLLDSEEVAIAFRSGINGVLQIGIRNKTAVSVNVIIAGCIVVCKEHISCFFASKGDGFQIAQIDKGGLLGCVGQSALYGVSAGAGHRA